MTSIFGIDPGETCGLFEFNYETGNLYHDELPPFDLATQLDTVVDTERVRAIGLERYTQQSTKLTPQHDALMVIGVVQYIARREGWHVVMQSRADKARVSNDTLRLIGWYSRIRTHSNDAARHALLTLSKIMPQHDIMRRVAGRI